MVIFVIKRFTSKKVDFTLWNTRGRIESRQQTSRQLLCTCQEEGRVLVWSMQGTRRRIKHKRRRREQSAQDTNSRLEYIQAAVNIPGKFVSNPVPSIQIIFPHSEYNKCIQSVHDGESNWTFFLQKKVRTWFGEWVIFVHTPGIQLVGSPGRLKSYAYSVKFFLILLLNGMDGNLSCRWELKWNGGWALAVVEIIWYIDRHIRGYKKRC